MQLTWFRKIWPHYIPIAYKLAMAMIVLILSGMFVLGLLIVANQERLMKQQLQELGTTLVQQLSESSKELILSEDELSLYTLVNNLRNNKSILGVAVYSDLGEPLAVSGVQPSADKIVTFRNQALLEAMNAFEWARLDVPELESKVVSFISPVKYKDLTAGYAQVTLSQGLMLQGLLRAKRVIIIATLLMGFLVSTVAFAMSKRVARPIHHLLNATDAISGGDYQYRINERRNDEIGSLIAGFNSMAEGLLKKSQVEKVFSRYVSKSVANKVLGNLEEVRLGGKHIKATVLFADIAGFTNMAESLPPAAVSNLLNEYFTYITIASRFYNGSIDKFIGDCAMVVFGLDESDEDHQYNAVACALLIQELAASLNVDRQRQGIPNVEFRIGINSGEMLAGNLGSEERMEYTVVGDSVNLASRLSSVGNEGQVIICEDLRCNDTLKDIFVTEAHKTIRVRGKSLPIATYRVLDMAYEQKKKIHEQVKDILKTKGKVYDLNVKKSVS